MRPSDQYLANEKAFLRNREMLLRERYGKFVIYNDGQLIGSCRNIDEVNKLIENLGMGGEPLEDIYITGVNEGNFEKDTIYP